MLPLLIEFGAKSALIAGAALLADRMLRGRPAAERVFVLRLAILLLLALPVAMWLLPPLDLAWLPAAEAPAEAVRTVAASAAPPVALPPEARIDLAGLFYAAGAGAVLLHLAMGIAILVRWTRRGAPADGPEWSAALARATASLRRPVRLLVSPDVATPISWGIAPAWILIDPDTITRTSQADAVLAHEAAHIRRFDWPMLIAARIAVALFWFNPLVWLLSRTLARRGETAADEAAVRGIERADYAEALLTFAAARPTRAAATGMALWPHALAERIAHIAMHRPRRGSRLLPVAAMACAAVAAPLAAVKLVHAMPNRAGPIGAVADRAGRASQPASGPIDSAADAARAAAAGPAAALPGTQSDAGDPPVAAVPAATDPAPARPGTPVIEQVLATANPTPRPTPQIVANPQIDPQLRIVGRGGAEVVRGPNGTTIIGGPPEAPAPVAAPAPAEQTPDWAKHAASELTQAAAEMREGARNVELTAELPGVTAGKRAEIRRNVRKMRDTADEFEARARALRGQGG